MVVVAEEDRVEGKIKKWTDQSMSSLHQTATELFDSLQDGPALRSIQLYYFFYIRQEVNSDIIPVVVIDQVGKDTRHSRSNYYCVISVCRRGHVL